MEALAVVLAVFATYVIYIIFTSRKQKSKPKISTSNNKAERKAQPTSKIQIDSQKEYFAWPHLMEYEFEVVGESYYQSAIEKIVKQQETKYFNNPDEKIEPLIAYLIPDDNNQYDDRAVRVDINGLQVGHLSREDARSFRRRLGAKKLTSQVTTCGALITGRHAKNGKQMDYGVVLDMKPFE